ncbi:MAG TPA: glycosyltransferase N-terminal domain-containing protein [Chitinispirillaceae bacterium]|nr:glycosyltransferase N-terminal domain-containing protein [Chitinispirillaceae bacterium]
MIFYDGIISSVVYVYSALFTLIRFVVFPFFKNIDRHRKWDLALRQRVPAAIRDYRKSKIVWVHAASLGEAKLLCKFLSILEQRYPEDMYVVTAVTRTGVEFLEKNVPDSVCSIGFFPLDTIPLVKKIITHYNIRRVWLLETELWPSMLWTLKSLGIPVGIVNGRIEEKSFVRYRRYRFLLKYFFEGFDIVLAQNQAYADRFRELGVNSERIHITGNIKGQVIIKRPSVHEWNRVRQDLGLSEQDLVICCGCVHAGEGIVLSQCIDALKKNGINCKMIVVPRYLNEVPDLIGEMGKDLVHLNDITASCKWEMCIIEKMGILDDMYMIADAAIIGGTFTNIGGHNVWDAARFGIPVFFGPDYHTQVDGCEKLITNGIGFKSQDAVELADLITDVLKREPKKFMQAQMLFMELINKSQSIPGTLLP